MFEFIPPDYFSKQKNLTSKIYAFDTLEKFNYLQADWSEAGV